MQVESSGDEAPEMAGASGIGSLARPACDQCRHRKIGCDREIPCSNCVRAGIDCKFTSAQRPKIRRQRVLISAQYERKIDAIEENLDQVVVLLNRLTTRLGSSSASSTAAKSPAALNPTSISSPASSASKIRPGTASAPVPVFEGDSSLASQTAFANNILENAVAHNEPLRPGMRDALAALRSLVETQKEHPIVHEARDTSSLTMPSTKKLEALPPVDLTMQSLRVCKDDRRMTFMIFAHMLSIDRLMDHVLRVYYPGPGEFTDADLIIVNSGMYAVFMERGMIEEDPETRQQLDGEVRRCLNNVLDAIKALPLAVPATMDYALALTLAASAAMEASTLNLASVATNAGLYISQTLGFHRIQTMKKDPPLVRQSKIWIFWMLYILDKGISLRVGKPSTVQDYDITVPIPEPSGDPAADGPFTYTFVRWIKLSKLQGEVYRLLYSPAASDAPQSVIATRANNLATEVRAAFRDLHEPTDVIKGHYAYWNELLPVDFLAVFDMSDEVIFRTTLTLILRAVPIPPGSRSSFIPECLSMGRSALDLHVQCVKRIGSCPEVLDFYIKWTILYSPFTPFIVVFCNCIETSDQSDLDRLKEFVDSLKDALEISDVTASQCRFFSILETVARRYVELKKASGSEPMAESETSLSPGTANDARGQLDGYLHALGIVPTLQVQQGAMMGAVGDGTAAATPMGEGPVFAGNGEGDTGAMDFGMGQQSGSLENWFYNGQQLMGLLDENYF